MSFSGTITSIIGGLSVSVAIQISTEDLRKISGLGQVSSEEEELADLFQTVLLGMPIVLRQAHESVSRNLMVAACECLQSEVTKFSK